MRPLGAQELTDAFNRVTERDNQVTNESDEAMYHHVESGLAAAGLGEQSKRATRAWVLAHLDVLMENAVELTPCGHTRCVLEKVLCVVMDEGIQGAFEVLRGRGFDVEFDSPAADDIARLEEWLHEGHDG